MTQRDKDDDVVRLRFGTGAEPQVRIRPQFVDSAPGPGQSTERRFQ
jgi:hypothetical protein